ncbi:MAG: uncharacterized protein QOD77_1569 [Thermoplasmata archaeon]|jgi:uncharacterized protein YqjF (DUF2071 family)|nr:uncharacterized protein [Thermoplasmata archaeon]
MPGRMGWRDVAFLHWPIPASDLRALVPEPLALDTHGQTAWVSAVALRMVGLRLGPLPLASPDFAVLNLRTYVTHDGVAGVWFLQNEAADRWFCAVSRRMGIPYRAARITLGADGVRSEPEGGAAPFAATWSSGARPPGLGLDAFLVERYSAYSVVGRRLLRTDVRHAPWPLDAANARVLAPGALPAVLAGAQPELAHTSPGVEATLHRARAVAHVG